MVSDILRCLYVVCPTDGCSSVDVHYQLSLIWLLDDIKRGQGIIFDR